MMKQNMRGERDEGSRARHTSENAKLPNAVSQCKWHACTWLDFQHSLPLPSQAGPHTHPPTQCRRARTVSGPPSQAHHLEPWPLEPSCLEPHPLKPRSLKPCSLKPIRLEPRPLKPAVSSPAVSNFALSSLAVSSPTLSSPAISSQPSRAPASQARCLKLVVSTLSHLAPSRARPHMHAPSQAHHLEPARVCALSHSVPSIPGPHRLTCAPFTTLLVPPSLPRLCLLRCLTCAP